MYQASGAKNKCWKNQILEKFGFTWKKTVGIHCALKAVGKKIL
jgi:hypothetical protein